MKKKLFLLSMVFVVCVSVSAVQAAIVSIDLNSLSGPSVSLGDQIDIQVLLTTDTALLGGGLDFSYTAGLVNLFNFATGTAVDPSLVIPPNTSTPGQVLNYEFSNFSGIAGSSQLLATMTFDTTAVGTAVFNPFVDSASAGLGLDGAYTGGWFDNNLSPITDFVDFTVTGTSVEITAVPIPGSILLLGAGLMGLVGVKRRTHI